MTETAPKLMPCPNTKCGKPCALEYDTYAWFATCGKQNCGYRGPRHTEELGAIRFHNLLCRAQQSAEPVAGQRPLNLKWGRHDGRGKYHIEWHAPCGCAYHPEPKPHVHPCIKHSEIDPCHDL